MRVPRRFADEANGYRYGFNGKEKDAELKGEGNSYNFGARIYDPRIGQFLSRDPLQRDFSSLSPYIYAANSPISHIDMDGKYALFIHYMLTRFKLMKIGVPEIVSNLIAHYASTFTDNPGSRTGEFGGKLLGRMLVEKNVTMSQEDNDIFSRMGGALNEEQAKMILYKKDIDYSRTKISQSEDAIAQKWHATRTYAESEDITKEAAVNRALSNAWSLLFTSAALSSLENMKINTVEIENLGMALHTFQDVQAHRGVVYRSTVKNGLGYMSTDGNEHDLNNDMYPSVTGFENAEFATESAILVHQALNGVLTGVTNNQRVYTQGMSKEQLEMFGKALQKGGYSLMELTRTDHLIYKKE